MRYAEIVRVASVLVLVLAQLGCSGSRPPPVVTPAPEPAPAPAPEPPPEPAPAPAPRPSGTASKASYDDALSTPEAIDVRDDHAHLTDGQLRGPMGGALAGCRLPSNAKVSIRTAVQRGRAIGVTVDVRFVRAKSTRAPSRATQRAEAKTAKKIVACVDRNVRAMTWPPSTRRDSFTTEF